jgi:hypothetical protein
VQSGQRLETEKARSTVERLNRQGSEAVEHGKRT